MLESDFIIILMCVRIWYDVYYKETQHKLNSKKNNLTNYFQLT